MKLFFLAVFLLGGIPAAQAQVNSWLIAAEALQVLSAGPALPAFLQKSSRMNSDPEFVYGVLQNAHRLQDQGLPPQPYLLKANEGLAKGIPPTHITPILATTRRQTEMAGSLVQEAQGRGWVFQNPRQRRQTIEDFQWALMSQTPPQVLRDFMGRTVNPGDFPGLWKSWKGWKGEPPAWGARWNHGPQGPAWSNGEKSNNNHKMDHHGPPGEGWGHMKKDHGPGHGGHGKGRHK